MTVQLTYHNENYIQHETQYMIISFNTFSPRLSMIQNLRKVPRLVLLDRDGVINEDVGPPGVLHPNQLVLTPGAGHAVARLKQAGCWIAIITNQSCVGKGLVSLEELHDIHFRLQEMLIKEHPQAQVDKIYQCTSTKENHNVNDPRQKPRPGMIYEAMADFSTTIDDCCFVGDTATDLEAAASASVPSRWLVATGYGSNLMKATTTTTIPEMEPVWIESIVPGIVSSAVPFWYCQNLAQAVDWILEP